MERTWREKIEGTTDQILAQIKRLFDEGNIRRVVVKQQGRVVAEFPLTVGVVGTVLAPVAAAIGALTAVLTECTIEVEKTGTAGDAGGAGGVECRGRRRRASGGLRSRRFLREMGPIPASSLVRVGLNLLD